MKVINDYVMAGLNRLMAFVEKSTYEEYKKTHDTFNDKSVFLNICTLQNVINNQAIRDLKYEYLEIIEANIDGKSETLVVFVLPDKPKAVVVSKPTPVMSVSNGNQRSESRQNQQNTNTQNAVSSLSKKDTPNMSLKQKLYDVVQTAYKNNSDVANYMKFRVIYDDPVVKTFGAEYMWQNRTIVAVFDNSHFEDLFLSLLIHAVSHHIQYCKEGQSEHDNNFYKIQKELLFTALDKHYIHPYKLKAYYMYLSNIRGNKRVIAMIDEYIYQRAVIQDVYFLGYCNMPYSPTINEELKKDGFRYYSGNSRYKNLWWKFSEKYLPTRTDFGEVIRV